MGLAQYGGAVLEGFTLAVGVMVFALAFTVLAGRWVTADESWVGVLVRGVLLLGLAGIALRAFGSLWFWAVLPLAMVPLIDELWGQNLWASWVRARRQQRLSEAMVAAAAQPANPITRAHLGRALLETGQIESGLAALEDAVCMAPRDSAAILSRMAEEAREEFVRECLACGQPNPHEARACRRCLGPLVEGAALRGLLWVCRPMLRRLRARSRS